MSLFGSSEKLRKHFALGKNPWKYPLRWKYFKKRKLFLVIGGLILGLIIWFSLPSRLFVSPLSKVLVDQNGELLGAAIASDGQWHFPSESTVPLKFEKCIITFEDRRFYYHPGVDPIALLRALRSDFKAGRYVSGGSTIPMQVIRLSRHKNRTIIEKVLEIFLALRLELSYSKSHILALYASNAPFGANVIGLEAASWRYFGRKAASLSWGEMAALAVLPNSPSLVHPGKNQFTLLAKRNRLLHQLVKNGTIDNQTALLAMAEPVPEKPHALPQIAPHLLARFGSQFASGQPNAGQFDAGQPELGYPENGPSKMGFSDNQEDSSRLRSTIDMRLQVLVSALLEKHAAQLRGRQIGNAAALVLNVETGAVLAYVGNTWHPEDPAFDSQVDVIQAKRSPGSTLKPFLYTFMMQEGFILPHSLIADVPTYIAGYNPQNFDLGYDGAVPASIALSRSLNVPAVRMLNQYKYARFYEKLRNIGFEVMNKGADNYGLSMILGGAETNLWELCGAYSGMARTLSHYNKYKNRYDPGDIHAPVYSLDIANRLARSNLRSSLQNSNNINGSSLQKSSVVSAGALWYTFQAMEEVARPGEEAWWRQFSSAYRLAWKTGTSFGFRDGWAIGITPRFVVGVWIGNTSGEGRPGLTGISVAAPLLFDIFRILPQGKWFEKPLADLIPMKICQESGFKAGTYCEHIITQDVPSGGIKSSLCPFHRLVHLNASGTEQVDASCVDVQGIRIKNWFVLPPVMEFYYRLRHPSYESLPPLQAGCGVGSGANSEGLELIYPLENAQIYIPLELSGKRGRVIFSAAERNTGTKLYWNLDSKFIGATRDFHQMSMAPDAGKHVLTIVSESGERLERHFQVLEKQESR